nr:helix-turn-helix domain-containing protein [Actinoplanes sp. RD1]
MSFRLSDKVVAPLAHALPDVAQLAIEAITSEVPAYREAFAGEMGGKIEKAVRAALGTFLKLVARAEGPDPGSPLAPALEAAYALGRGEARQGRSLDALLAAYRVGARVAWRELAAISVRSGQPASTIAHFAELVFAYIDELSAASVTGHADELALSGRERRRRLERLAQVLLAGEPPQVVAAAAEQADWQPPQTLTAVLLPASASRSIVDLLDARTLHVPGDDRTTVLLVPDASRAPLLGLLAAERAVVGPARPWLQVRDSLDRATRVARIAGSSASGSSASGSSAAGSSAAGSSAAGSSAAGSPASGHSAGVLDAEDHLVELVVGADARGLADLREKALAPLSGETDAAAAKLIETLRSWLLHQGRREDVAADLFVHPQTVRYRMTRLRDIYGDRLRDPAWILLLTVALAVPDPQG